MKYPTRDEVRTADRFQICKWYRFLPAPANEEEGEVINYICLRFTCLGGMTPQISKAIGW